VTAAAAAVAVAVAVVVMMTLQVGLHIQHSRIQALPELRKLDLYRLFHMAHNTFFEM
jgi:hypothetical protein